jgi:D-beta-D-heptose 7-phosphate kinase/D-beta-D-heptose 1-phosphate adenosyltransferase
MKYEEAVKWAEERRRQGFGIAFTNGCYDILTVGHTRFLQWLADELDRRVDRGKPQLCLVVGLNSDESVRCLKGKGRPINKEADRKEVLEALHVVDKVFIFDEDTPEQLITALMPELLAKGGDYKDIPIVGEAFVLSRKGEVLRSGTFEGPRTSDIVGQLMR